MNPVDRLPEDSIFDEAAAEWLIERDDGFAPERAKAFADWCLGDPRHAEAVRRVEHSLSLLAEMPALRAPLEARLASVRSASTTRAIAQIIHFPRRAWATGLAAVLVVGMIAWWSIAVRVPASQHYKTDTTAQRSLALPDGSVLDLNVGSDVSVQFTAAERRITLERGEAHFQVAHDRARPFIVTAGNVSVRAVGTAFDVRLATEAVDVVVVEGKIELGRDEVLSSDISVAPPPLVRAGERAQISRLDQTSAPKIDKIEAAAIQTMLTWQTPMTRFTDVPLRDVVARFNRRNVTQLTLKDADLGERRIGGMIALDQVDAFVRLLVQDGEIVAERQPDGQIGLRRAR